LILKHDQNAETSTEVKSDFPVYLSSSLNDRQNIARVPMVQRSGWDFEKQEESYFNDVQEEEKQAVEAPTESEAPPIKKLVDYPDDEEENLVLRTKSKSKLAINLKKDRPPEAPLEFVRSSLDELPQSDHTTKKRKL
jgi:hypothetical protein